MGIMAAPHLIDTNRPEAVAEAVKAVFKGIGGEASFPLIDRVFADISDFFEGRRAGYQAIDMEYHDFEHTLQVTMCLTHLLEGHSFAGASPVLEIRAWELAVMAALLHDTGFLKETGDDEGTGAKYTFVHEHRSCKFARKYLPELALTKTEIEDICSAVMCTGPRNDITKATFRCEEARQIALILVTSDYLAQMSAADYLEKLPRLYLEFEEAFKMNNVPPEKRPYHSLEELLEMTPGFWNGYVLPLLENEACGTYKYLAVNKPTNPYLDSIEENLEKLRGQLAECAK